MATLSEKTYLSQPESSGEGITLPSVARTILRPLASLRITVALFAMAIFIIWVATLAQSEKDMWDVINDYFWTPLAFIEFQFLFPYQWLPTKVDIPLSYGFPFPGGATIGVAMAINLLAAHLVRFKIQAKGMPLLWGTLITLLGAGLTLLVIVSGHNSEGLQASPPFAWPQLWLCIKFALIVGWLGLLYPLTRIDYQKTPILARACIAALVGYGFLLVLLFTSARAWYPGDPAMRVMWQLIQGGFAAIVILAGCLLLFRKRAGIVVIHLAVAMLLIGESYVSYNNVEERMQIREGEAINFARDIRVTELAVVDRSDEKTEQHTVIPESMLTKKKLVENEELPFDVQVVEYFKNSDVRPINPEDDNPATAGSGLKFLIKRLTPSSGTDMGGKVDFASAYVRLTDKESSDELGTYLVSQLLSLQDIYEQVTVDETTYDLSLRFKRTYKPYSIYLHDVQKNDYIGTTTAQDYRSIVTLVDPSRGVKRSDINIWMNNPLRYAGETFYQSNFIGATRPGGPETTEFQVVANTGWMIPYVACMMALVGMAYHFLQTFVRFTNRVGRESRAEPVEAWSIALTAVTVVIGVGIVLYSLRPPATSSNEMNLVAFGKLPVADSGRTKPLDTLARRSLEALSGRQAFTDAEGEKHLAVRWLLDMMAKPELADDHKVIRIYNDEVRELLELEKTDDFRYSYNQIADNGDKFIEQLIQADKARQEDKDLNAYQNELINLKQRLDVYRSLVVAMRPLQLTPIPTRQQIAENPEALDTLGLELRALLTDLPQKSAAREQMQLPRAVYDNEAKTWKVFAQEWEMTQARERIPYVIEVEEPLETSPSAKAFNAIVAAYAKDNVKQVNQAIAAYENLLDKQTPDQYSSYRASFESYFNYVDPFTNAMVIYLLAFALSAVGMLVWNRELNRAAFGLIIVGLILHTLALAGRVYISQRPPVTNLYSSAVFIGWASVVLCLIVEAIYKIGIGNLIATVAGASTLIIAWYLGTEGDTFTVLVAVLDTQFWLTTHVICVTIGYATTFVAGLFGMVYLIGRLASPDFAYTTGKDIIRMCYGVVCFAIFFSFLGTVLGGLWADDSWGRFWGWDPKENGALIIVLWNALILHARWGGMVKDRGLATLAVAGNVVTSWSWFGVNQLGIGLHSYGFTSGVVVALTLFVISQLAIMMLAIIPSQPVNAKPAGR